MFDDKGPIRWRADRPPLVLRKLVRQAAASGPAMAGLEWAAALAERRARLAALRGPLGRWLVSGYIFRGYRQGLKELR
jgi:hypothetical protein